MNVREELSIKHARVAAYLREHDLDAVLLSRRCNFSWYTCGAHNYVSTGCDVGNSHLLVTADSAEVLTNNIEATRLSNEELPATGIEVRSFAYFDAEARQKLFEAALGSLRVAADASVAGLDLPPLEADFDRLRWTLTAREIDRYRELCQDTAAAVEAVAQSAEPGQTENELAGLLACSLRSAGCTPWVLLVGGDERARRLRHPLATDAKVKEYFMLVAGAERHGLVAASTRVACFRKVPGDLAEKHRAAVTVDAALTGATRPGAPLGEIFDVACEAYREVGFGDEWRMHHQGGSIGYLPREVKAAPGEDTAVLEDQAFAWNPSIAGTKSEVTVLCRGDQTVPLEGPTDWPSVTGQWKGFKVRRPGILAI
ncbi:MAG: M24 family metallopeptidase [Phycisphaerae bacterium]